MTCLECLAHGLHGRFVLILPLDLFEIVSRSPASPDEEKNFGGEVHPTSSDAAVTSSRRGGREGVAKGSGGEKTAPTSEYVAGTGSLSYLSPRARRGLVPGTSAAAAARHSLRI